MPWEEVERSAEEWVPVLDWILATGYWDDLAVWVDGADWRSPPEWSEQ